MEPVIDILQPASGWQRHSAYLLHLIAQVGFETMESAAVYSIITNSYGEKFIKRPRRGQRYVTITLANFPPDFGTKICWVAEQFAWYTHQSNQGMKNLPAFWIEPPKSALCLLALFLSDDRLEEEIGNVQEKYQTHCRLLGRKTADLRFWRNTIRSVIPVFGVWFWKNLMPKLIGPLMKLLNSKMNSAS